MSFVFQFRKCETNVLNILLFVFFLLQMNRLLSSSLIYICIVFTSFNTFFASLLTFASFLTWDESEKMFHFDISSVCMKSFKMRRFWTLLHFRTLIQFKMIEHFIDMKIIFIDIKIEARIFKHNLINWPLNQWISNIFYATKYSMIFTGFLP